jgi:hypothetical protein
MMYEAFQFDPLQRHGLLSIYIFVLRPMCSDIWRSDETFAQ